MKNLLDLRNIEEICSMKIIPLKEGNFSASKTKDFSLLTEENWNTAAGIKMSVQPFLIVTQNDYILLDAGIGWKMIMPILLFPKFLLKKIYIRIR